MSEKKFKIKRDIKFRDNIVSEVPFLQDIREDETCDVDSVASENNTSAELPDKKNVVLFKRRIHLNENVIGEVPVISPKRVLPILSIPENINDVTEEHGVKSPEIEFDEIYEHISKTPIEIDNNIIENANIEDENTDPAVVEVKFEEILHSYENKQRPMSLDAHSGTKQSKIPIYRQLSETGKRFLSRAPRRRSLDNKELESNVQSKIKSFESLEKIDNVIDNENKDGVIHYKYVKVVSDEDYSPNAKENKEESVLIKDPLDFAEKSSDRRPVLAKFLNIPKVNKEQIILSEDNTGETKNVSDVKKKGKSGIPLLKKPSVTENVNFSDDILIEPINISAHHTTQSETNVHEDVLLKEKENSFTPETKVVKGGINNINQVSNKPIIVKEQVKISYPDANDVTNDVYNEKIKSNQETKYDKTQIEDEKDMEKKKYKEVGFKSVSSKIALFEDRKKLTPKFVKTLKTKSHEEPKKKIADQNDTPAHTSNELNNDKQYGGMDDLQYTTEIINIANEISETDVDEPKSHERDVHSDFAITEDNTKNIYEVHNMNVKYDDIRQELYSNADQLEVTSGPVQQGIKDRKETNAKPLSQPKQDFKYKSNKDIIKIATPSPMQQEPKESKETNEKLLSEPKNDVIKSDENIIKVNNDFNKAEKNIIVKTEIKARKDVIKSDKKIIKAGKDLIKSERNILKENGDKMKQDKNIIESDQNIIKEDKSDKNIIKTDNDQNKSEKGVSNQDKYTIKSGKNIIKEDNDLVKSDKNIIKVDNHMIKSNTNILKADNSKIESEEKIIKADNDITKSDKNIMKSDDDIIKTKENIFKPEKYIIKPDKNIINVHNDITKSDTDKINVDDDIIKDNDIKSDKSINKSGKDIIKPDKYISKSDHNLLKLDQDLKESNEKRLSQPKKDIKKIVKDIIKLAATQGTMKKELKVCKETDEKLFLEPKKDIIKSDETINKVENDVNKADKNIIQGIIKLDKDRNIIKADDVIKTVHDMNKSDRDVIKLDQDIIKSDINIINDNKDFNKSDKNITKVEKDKIKSEKNIINVENDMIKSDKIIKIAEDDIVKSDKKIIKGDKDMMKSDKIIKKVEDDIVKSDKNIVKADDGIIKSDRNIQKAEDDIVKAEKNIIRTDKNIIKIDNDIIKSDKIIKKAEDDINKSDMIKTDKNIIKRPLAIFTPKSTEEIATLKRAKSLVDIELGNKIKGKVGLAIKELFVDRVFDKPSGIAMKERPRRNSVSEKIALFEKKITPVQMDHQPLTIQDKLKMADATPPVISFDGYDDQPVPGKTLPKLETEADRKQYLIDRLMNVKEELMPYEKYDIMPFYRMRDGNKMPVIALGSALLLSDLTKYVVAAAIDLGYRAIDTAYIYGNEKQVGEGIQMKIDDGTIKREDIFVISKLWNTYHAPQLVETACRDSLRTLGLDYVDLYLIHQPMSFKEGPDPTPMVDNKMQYSDQHDFLDAWKSLIELKRQKLVRSIGVSNFNVEQLQTLINETGETPAVNQIECHPYLTQRALSDFCAANHIAVSAYGALGSKGTPAEYKSSNASAVLDDPTIRHLAKRSGLSPTQILLRYQLERGHCIVVKSTTPEHLLMNLSCLNMKLTKQQVTLLDQLNRDQRNFDFRGMGDTHKNYPFSAFE